MAQIWNLNSICIYIEILSILLKFWQFTQKWVLHFYGFYIWGKRIEKTSPKEFFDIFMQIWVWKSGCYSLNQNFRKCTLFAGSTAYYQLTVTLCAEWMSIWTLNLSQLSAWTRTNFCYTVMAKFGSSMLTYMYKQVMRNIKKLMPNIFCSNTSQNAQLRAHTLPFKQPGPVSTLIYIAVGHLQQAPLWWK